MADLDALLNVPEEGACAQSSPSRMITPSKLVALHTDYSVICRDGSSLAERVDECDKIATPLCSEGSGPQAVLARTDDRKRQRTVLTRECVNRCMQGGLFQLDECAAPGYGWHDHGAAHDSKHTRTRTHITGATFLYGAVKFYPPQCATRGLICLRLLCVQMIGVPSVEYCKASTIPRRSAPQVAKPLPRLPDLWTCRSRLCSASSR